VEAYLKRQGSSPSNTARRGFNPSILHGAAGAARAQETLLATAHKLRDAGSNPSILHGAAGAARAQETLLATAHALRDAGSTW
jgi:hypothetical protein